MPENEFPHLGDGAPITEAIIAVNFEHSEDLDEASLSNFSSAIAEKFEAEKEQTFSFETVFELKDGKPEVLQKRIAHGFKITFEKGAYVLQCTPEVLALSKLQQYENGDTFIDKFKIFWDMYCSIVQPSKIRRIGMRYINNIECTHAEYKKFFNITPGMVLDGVGIRTISSMHTVYSKDLNCSAIIRTNEVGSTDWKDDTTLKILLDIDAYRELDSSVLLFEGVRDALNQIRCMKNKIFFMNLTQDGRVRFDKSGI